MDTFHVSVGDGELVAVAEHILKWVKNA